MTLKKSSLFDRLLDQLRQSKCVVHTKNWSPKLDTIIDYLRRNDRKIALTNRRIVEIEDDEVRLRYKDCPAITIGTKPEVVYKTGNDSYSEIALHFGIHSSTVGRIIRQALQQ